MKIDKKYRLWEVPNKLEDDSRPSLEQVFVSRVKPVEQPLVTSEDYPEWMVLPLTEEQRRAGYNGVAVVTNSFTIAVVPITLDEDDVVGTFDNEVLKTANQKASVQDMVYILLRDEQVIIPFLNQQTTHREIFTYPDFRTIINDARERFTNDGNKVNLRFDMVHAIGLCKAIGIKTTGKPDAHDAGLSLYSLAKDKDNGNGNYPGMVLVSPKSLSFGSTIYPPFGLIMELSQARGR